MGIGAVLEQEGGPVICVSRKLTVTEQGYSQTQQEALVVFWAVKRLNKYSLRKPVLEDLHSGHPGVEKMKSLARLTCW